MFQKAQKQQLKARVAFVGPTGSGKTWTALEWASVLAGPGGRIAVIDTENNSAAYYSDRFEFDTCPVDEPYEPHRLTAIIREAAKEGYDAVVIDSLSHFWEGEGGVLDIADAAGQRAGGNSFAGWKTATPQLRNLIDVLRSANMHVIVTMRSKMEWVVEKDERTGKTAPKKIGMAPVMRQGVEYEFTAVVDMDLEHRGAVTKSRCSEIADVVMQPHRAAETAAVFGRWLGSGEAVVTRGQQDELTGAFDAIPSEDRRAAKGEFLTKFGHPERLPASRFDEALSWVQGHTPDPKAGESTGKSGNGTRSTPEPEPVVDQPKLVDAPVSNGHTPITSRGDGRYTPQQQKKFFALWGQLTKDPNRQWVEADRKERISAATGGRTDSWKDVTQLEADQLIGDLEALADGRA